MSTAIKKKDLRQLARELELELIAAGLKRDSLYRLRLPVDLPAETQRVLCSVLARVWKMIVNHGKE